MSKRAEQWVIPIQDFVQIAPGVPATPTPCPENTRGLLIETAGTLNVTMANGQERDGVPFQQGYNVAFIAAVRAGGTASNIWATI